MVKLQYIGIAFIGIAALLLSFTAGREYLAGVIFSQQEPVVHIGGAEMSVSVARTLNERRRGLSGTYELPELGGKLFIFERSERHGIWMKDMNYPIDIFWIDEDEVVVHIEEDVSPKTFPKSFRPSDPAIYVLETNANFARDYSVRVGDQVDISDAAFE